MEFQQLTKEAKDWAAKSNFCLKQADSDPAGADKKLVFTHASATDVSFYVVASQKVESGELQWHVWSENDKVLKSMSGVHDFLDTAKARPLEDVLNKVAKEISDLCSTADDEDMDDDEDDDNDYYGGEDPDAMEDDDTALIAARSLEYKDVDAWGYAGPCNAAAVNRLLQDLRNMKDANGKYGVTGTPKGDNLFIWDVELTDFDLTTPLGKDLVAFAKKHNRKPHIYMEMKFPQDYPMSPPFARVIRPRFQFLTGHVTIGGSICMEMLTKSGWLPTNDIEGILVQVRSEVMSDGTARLDYNPDRPYDEAEANQAFQRMVLKYGWNN